MPNWCSNYVRIICKSNEDAQKVSETLCKWMDADEDNDTDFGKKWLGKFLIQAGVVDRDSINSVNIGCRGWVDWIEPDFNEVRVETQTAWGPQINMWKLIADKHWPGVVKEILYDAVEPGSEIYWTNDPDLLNEPHYIVRADELDQDPLAESDLTDYLTDLLRRNGIEPDKTDPESLQEEVKKCGIDMEINKYEYVDIEECV
jgi:hypothetical protein